MIKKIFLYTLLTLIVIVVGSFGICYYSLQQFSKQQINVTPNNQMFVLKKGTSIHQLITQLKEAKLLDRAFLLPYLYKLDPSLSSIKAGTYQLHPHMTVEEFLRLLVSGKESNFSIQFVEGKRAKDWLKVIQNTPYIQQTLTEKTDEEIAKLLGIEGSIEGWLTPDTYLYTADTLDINILKRAHMTMKSNLQKIWEIGRASCRERVIRRIDLTDTENPYNTYVIDGLPPTPIAMPSLASLEAAAHPAKTNYLFFVANGTGGHTFSDNYGNHQQAVNEYRRLIK